MMENRLNFLSSFQKRLLLQLLPTISNINPTLRQMLLPPIYEELLPVNVCQNFEPANKCIICCKTFKNSFIRDYHLRFYHGINLDFLCEKCTLCEEESETKFNSVYLFHLHNIECHNDSTYQFSHILFWEWLSWIYIFFYFWTIERVE